MANVFCRRKCLKMRNFPENLKMKLKTLAWKQLSHSVWLTILTCSFDGVFCSLFGSVPSPRRGFGGLSTPKQCSKPPPNWNMKHYKLVKFLSNLNVKPRCTNVKSLRTNEKPPYWRLSGDGSGSGECCLLPSHSLAYEIFFLSKNAL